MAPLKRVKSLSLIAENTIVKMLSKIEWDIKDEEVEDEGKYQIIYKLQKYFNDYTNVHTSDKILQSCCAHFDQYREENVLALAVRVVLHRETVRTFKPCGHDINIFESDRKLAEDTIVGIKEFLFRLVFVYMNMCSKLILVIF